MKIANHQFRQRKRSAQPESGYVLLAILFMLTLAIIALAAVAPSIATAIKRDREIELQHRGNQYVRALQLYFRKFGRYPASIDQLENTNNIRFLRKRYKDPITGKDEWKLIRLGQAHPKPRPAYLAGATPASGMAGATPAAAMAGGTPVSNIGGSGAPSTSSSPSGGFSLFGGSSGSPNSGRPGGSPGSSSPGGGFSGGNASGTSSSPSGIANASDISKQLGGASGVGAPIVGVASTSDKESLKEMDGKNKYSDWEFTYDPTLDTTRGISAVPQQGSGIGGGIGSSIGGTMGGQPQPTPATPNIGAPK
jgi:type II secretory pathway pseudopilin PulG